MLSSKVYPKGKRLWYSLITGACLPETTLNKPSVFFFFFCFAFGKSYQLFTGLARLNQDGSKQEMCHQSESWRCAHGHDRSRVCWSFWHWSDKERWFDVNSYIHELAFKPLASSLEWMQLTRPRPSFLLPSNLQWVNRPTYLAHPAQLRFASPASFLCDAGTDSWEHCGILHFSSAQLCYAQFSEHNMFH